VPLDPKEENIVLSIKSSSHSEKDGEKEKNNKETVAKEKKKSIVPLSKKKLYLCSNKFILSSNIVSFFCHISVIADGALIATKIAGILAPFLLKNLALSPITLVSSISANGPKVPVAKVRKIL
jgi:hypothetical protein